MKIILKQDIKKVGQVGDVVEVSDGFARNFLIPQGKAISFTMANFKQIEYLKKKEAEKKEGELKEVKELAEKINNISLEIKVKAGEEGKLFGSVTSKDIVETLFEKHGIELDKKKLLYLEESKNYGQNRHLLQLRLLLEKHGIELDKKKLNLKESLKKLGIHTVPVNLHKDITPQIKVSLISDSESEQVQETEEIKEK